jgi:hypothetical protein
LNWKILLLSQFLVVALSRLSLTITHRRVDGTQLKLAFLIAIAVAALNSAGWARCQSRSSARFISPIYQLMLLLA